MKYIFIFLYLLFFSQTSYSLDKPQIKSYEVVKLFPELTPETFIISKNKDDYNFKKGMRLIYFSKSLNLIDPITKNDAGPSYLKMGECFVREVYDNSVEMRFLRKNYGNVDIKKGDICTFQSNEFDIKLPKDYEPIDVQTPNVYRIVKLQNQIGYINKVENYSLKKGEILPLFEIKQNIHDSVAKDYLGKPEDQIGKCKVVKTSEKFYEIEIIYSVERNVLYPVYPLVCISNIENKFQLPFVKDQNLNIAQSIDGPQITHKNDGVNAIDFAVVAGTLIVAAKDGIVIEVVDHFTKGGLSDELLDKANYIKILHKGNLISEYLHIQNKSAIIKKGDTVSSGDPIAKVGNTGFSYGPHLHFQVNQCDKIKIENNTVSTQAIKYCKIVPIKFFDSKEKEIIIEWNKKISVE